MSPGGFFLFDILDKQKGEDSHPLNRRMSCLSIYHLYSLRFYFMQPSWPGPSKGPPCRLLYLFSDRPFFAGNGILALYVPCRSKDSRMERGGISLPAQLSPEGRNLNGMLFPYLSSTPLGKGRRSGLPGIHSGVWLLPDPWDSNPSVVLTELRTEVSLCCDGSWLYTGSNPVLTGRFAHLQGWRSLHAAADVAPHHRVVPEEWYALFKVQEKEFLGSLHVQVYPSCPANGRY